MSQISNKLGYNSPTDIVSTIKACSGILKGFKRYALSLYLLSILLTIPTMPIFFVHASTGLGFSHADMAILKAIRSINAFPYNTPGYLIQLALLVINFSLNVFFTGAIFAMAQNWIQNREKKWFNIKPAIRAKVFFKCICASFLYLLTIIIFYFAIAFVILIFTIIIKHTTPFVAVFPIVLTIFSFLIIFMVMPVICVLLIGINRGDKVRACVKLWWNNKWAFVQLLFNVLALIIVSLATLGIALIWLYPLIILTYVQTYNNCLESKQN